MASRLAAMARPGLVALLSLLSACSLPETPPPIADRQACRAPAAGAAGGTVGVGAGLPDDPSLPEPSSGYRPGLRPVLAQRYLVVTAHPLASRAGCEVLRAGGSAADAAVAVQAVLGLVEPQSSGIGGGAFVVHYDAATGSVQTYDGRETAPAAATEDALRRIGAGDPRAPLPDARRSGRSIGTPGAVRMLSLLHADHGRRPWVDLFEPAIRLAGDGFVIGGRMADAIAAARADLLRDPDAAAYFLQPDGSAKPRGTVLRNPAYADTLQRIAREGADAFYTGTIAQDIVDEIAREAAGPLAPGPLTRGSTTLADLAGHAALRRAPVCVDYRATRICGMGPPSSGAIAVGQTLGMLEHFDLAALAPSAVDGHGGRPSVAGVHLVSEAERLAYADRNRYVADTDFVPLPGGSAAGLLDRTYLQRRAALIRLDRSLGVAAPGAFADLPARGSSAQEGRGTSHVSIVDARGNAVSMTTSIESSMGSFRLVRGFLLNNQLTDFSAQPADPSGPIANRVAPGKRPRSSMAPTLVFRRGPDGALGDLLMVTGSPGGANIIQYVTKTLVGVLDWGLDAQQSAALVNFGAGNGPTTGIGGEHPDIAARDGGATDPLVIGLRALGHGVSVAAQSSGVSTILRVRIGDRERWQGGVDPRREGLALGDGGA